MTALLDDPHSWLHPSMTPADIGRLVERYVSCPRWFRAGGSWNSRDKDHDNSSDSTFMLGFDSARARARWIALPQPWPPLGDGRTCLTLSEDDLPLVLRGDWVLQWHPRSSEWLGVAYNRVPDSSCSLLRSQLHVVSVSYSGTVSLLQHDTWVQGRHGSHLESVHHAVGLDFQAAAVLIGTARNSVSSMHGGMGQCARHDLTTGHQVSLPSLWAPQSATDFQLIALEKCVYACGGGGYHGDSETQPTLGRLDLASPVAWQPLASPPCSRLYGNALAPFDENIFVSFGGKLFPGAGECSTALAYDSRADRWWEEKRWELNEEVVNHAVVRF